MGARDGEGGDGVGEEAESEPSSGGGVGMPVRGFAGTDLERNLGMGSLLAAGDALKEAPAYAPWTFTGVEWLMGASSESVKEAVATADGEKTRSEAGCEFVCFFAFRGPLGKCTSSLEKTALSEKAGSWRGAALCAAAAWASPWGCAWPLGARLPLRRRCDALPLLAGGVWVALLEWWCLPRGARGDDVFCVLDM